LLGLTTVRGLGEDVAKAIVVERSQHGAFQSLPDLLRRTALPRNIAENLISVGALAEFGIGRRELLWQLGLLHGFNTSPKAPTRQLVLALPTEQDMVQLPSMTDWERMVADYGLLGLSPSYHPMALLRPDLPPDILSAEQVRATHDGVRVRTAGMVVCRQRPGTAKGFVFLLLEDETGLVNIVIKPDLYTAQRSTIRGEPYLCVEGTVQNRSGTLNLIATRVTPLSTMTATAVVARVSRAPDVEVSPNGHRSLPRAPERNGVPGAPHDPRERASAELLLATPPSRDFH
jgi:error-prone DNA polymerase